MNRRADIEDKHCTGMVCPPSDRAATWSRRSFLRRSLACAAIGGMGIGRAFGQDGAVSATIMTAGEPSRTARGAALYRAVHQVIDYPRVFEDPFALAILGPLAPTELQSVVDRNSRGMRGSIALRSRYAEDCLADAVARGTRQYVLLGAGLDTYSCRNPHASAGLQVYEVDHPATQREKRRRLQAAGIALQPGTRFVPVDFETQTLRAVLASSGFRFDQPAFFSMLGVSIYITDEAMMSTLRTVAACAAGSEIVFSFSVPEEMLGVSAGARRQWTIQSMVAAGEPWITFYEPAALSERLLEAGYASAEVLHPSEANRRYFAARRDGLRAGGVRMMLARV